MGPDAMILAFWMLSFKPTFSLCSFTFIKRLFSSSLSAIRVVSSAYLRLLIFLPAILISAFVSCSPAFLKMYSACKLNKQGDNIQPWCTPFLIWNQSVVPCTVLLLLNCCFLLINSSLVFVFPQDAQISHVLQIWSPCRFSPGALWFAPTWTGCPHRFPSWAPCSFLSPLPWVKYCFLYPWLPLFGLLTKL